MNNPTPDRIERMRRVTAACAIDTVPLLAARVQALLWWGRPISVATRWLDSDSQIELKAGLGVDDQADRPVGLRVDADCARFSVLLAPGIEGLAFGAYTSDGDATEAEVWKRYHCGNRREITIVTVDGGFPGDGGPGRDDRRYWNQHGVGRETVVGFDTEVYYRAWQERQDRGWQAGGESHDVAYCKQFAQDGRFRLTCGLPLADGVCAAAGDHVDVGQVPA